MPIYEFHCEDCGKNFDKLCSMKENLADINCKHCASSHVVKKMSSFSTAGNRNNLQLGESSCSSCSSGSCSTCSS